ncbi:MULTISPECIES: hypothetical protein [unclassified Amycolatopsis]|uniref:hypothetical protein n=1 Tax=unclassified Amycolatopsis TaxID=2618356 RepID=UPI002875B68A|nr:MULTISPECIES: hypothetical protein [unclassified Amycolatopsis]MDS0134287.1 hypothetical protein [Amycolatopsis sp. 505]MDS0149614.1 hypothetical protein [Amycolatopsis sp. CM201R]
MVTGPRWQDVLYGRTVRADRWWRVRPLAPDTGWLNAMVTATVAGGEGLATGPRFLLARREDALLVGTATQADRISETKNSDGTRPLYCFVGWLSLDREANVPELDVIEQNWTVWAGEVYESWMPLDWNRHPTALADAHEPPLKCAPWQELPGNSGQPGSDRARTWHDQLGIREDFALEVSSLATRFVDSPGSAQPVGEGRSTPHPAVRTVDPQVGDEVVRESWSLPGRFSFGKRKAPKEPGRPSPAGGPGADLSYWAGIEHSGDPGRRPERRTDR